MVTSMLFDTRHTVPSAVAKDIWIEKLNKIDKVFDSIQSSNHQSGWALDYSTGVRRKLLEQLRIIDAEGKN